MFFILFRASENAAPKLVLVLVIFFFVYQQNYRQVKHTHEECHAADTSKPFLFLTRAALD